MRKVLGKVFYFFLCTFTASIQMYMTGSIVMSIVAFLLAPLFWFFWILNGTLVTPEGASVIKETWATYWSSLL